MTLERPPVTEPIKQAIRDAFAIVPEGKTTAIVAIYDIEGREGRIHIASKIGEHWRVGGWIGLAKEKRATGVVAIEAAW
jgi:hypothetical protein